MLLRCRHPESLILESLNTVKPILSDHSKIDKTKVLKTGGSLMQVKYWRMLGSILQCVRSALSNIVLKSYF